MSTELKLSPRVTQWTVQAVMRTLSAFAVIQGCVIVLTDYDRWNDLAFSFALKVPGAPPIWGVVIFIAGALGLMGSFTGKMKAIFVGMFLASMWASFFTVSLLASAFVYEEVSFTGAISYLAQAVLFALLGVAYRESR